MSRPDAPPAPSGSSPYLDVPRPPKASKELSLTKSQHKMDGTKLPQAVDSVFEKKRVGAVRVSHNSHTPAQKMAIKISPPAGSKQVVAVPRKSKDVVPKVHPATKIMASRSTALSGNSDTTQKTAFKQFQSQPSVVTKPKIRVGKANSKLTGSIAKPKAQDGQLNSSVDVSKTQIAAANSESEAPSTKPKIRVKGAKSESTTPKVVQSVAANTKPLSTNQKPKIRVGAKASESGNEKQILNQASPVLPSMANRYSKPEAKPSNDSNVQSQVSLTQVSVSNDSTGIVHALAGIASSQGLQVHIHAPVTVHVYQKLRSKI